MARSVPAIVVIELVALFAVGPAMGASNTAQVPDLAGSWARATFALEQPVSGPGPLRNPARRADSNADPDPAVVKQMNVMLKPFAVELVKKRFEATRAGTPPPTPSSSC